MIYKQFKDKKLSALAFGCMRLPIKNGVYADIDEQMAAEMIDYAMKNGVNYYDTAWGYHDGNSEIAMGKILSKYPRESFYLASKFPGYDLSNMDKVEEIFERQLEKCQVKYFDFYLIHNVCEMNIDHYLDEKYGIFDYLLKQKQNGRIKHLGFSAHGEIGVIQRFGKIWSVYGVWTAANKLFGLGFSKGERKNTAFDKLEYTCVGYGAFAWRKACIPCK